LETTVTSLNETYWSSSLVQVDVEVVTITVVYMHNYYVSLCYLRW